MNTTAPAREPDEHRDHLDVFREFLAHLASAARHASATAVRDDRPRPSSR
ncbi:MAG TPA: hypothetical protein VH558_10510 [Pseudolabrys sp.]